MACFVGNNISYQCQQRVFKPNLKPGCLVQSFCLHLTLYQTKLICIEKLQKQLIIYKILKQCMFRNSQVVLLENTKKSYFGL